MEGMCTPGIGFPPIPGVHTPLGSDVATWEEGAAANGDKMVYDAAPGAIATHEMSAAPEVRGHALPDGASYAHGARVHGHAQAHGDDADACMHAHMRTEASVLAWHKG